MKQYPLCVLFHSIVEFTDISIKIMLRMSSPRSGKENRSVWLGSSSYNRKEFLNTHSQMMYSAETQRFFLNHICSCCRFQNRWNQARRTQKLRQKALLWILVPTTEFTLNKTAWSLIDGALASLKVLGQLTASFRHLVRRMVGQVR
jgi:hypothetical protein